MIVHDDCLRYMQLMEPNSVDAIVTDPPYGLSFMGKGWDKGVPGIPFWEAMRDALKPGAYLLAFGGTRTFHRMAVAIEDAGFEIRDTLSWLYGSGFPKSHDVGKAIDKLAGAEREVIGRKPGERYKYDFTSDFNPENPSSRLGSGDAGVLSAPATDAAKQWDGWGTALKPAWEPIIVARKPLAESTIAANVLTHGTGAINVDACRIEGAKGWPDSRQYNPGFLAGGSKDTAAYQDNSANPSKQLGRWPANVVLDDEAAALLDAQSGERKSGGRTRGHMPSRSGYDGGWKRVDGDVYGDTGGASRFFLNVPLDDPDAEISHDSGHFMVQYDCNCEATEGGEWVSQDHQASIQAASDTPPKRDTTVSISGTVSEAGPSWPMCSNGNGITDPFLTDSKSTTSTSTSKTTASRTCNCLTPSPTSASIPAANCETVNGGSRAASAGSSSPSMPSTGISPERDGLLTDDAAPAISAESLPINSGDALRFAYVPKASRAERSAGLDSPSIHPTVKPISLMRWLVRLVTPPGGVVLDPFAGSGTTGCAAALEGFEFIGIEREAEYVAIAERRIAHWSRQPALIGGAA